MVGVSTGLHGLLRYFIVRRHVVVGHGQVEGKRVCDMGVMFVIVRDEEGVEKQSYYL